MKPNRDPDFIVSALEFYLEEMVYYNTIHGFTNRFKISSNGRLMRQGVNDIILSRSERIPKEDDWMYFSDPRVDWTYSYKYIEEAIFGEEDAKDT